MSCPCGNGDWYHGCLSGIRNRNGAGAVGGQMGLSPFETLGAVYVGLKLFGIAGLFLGPLGLLLIEDMTELLITQPMNDEQRHNETNKSAMIDGGNRFMSH